MKLKQIGAALVILSMLAGCGHPLTTAKREYPTYGFFNESTSKSKDVCYEVSVGNVVWSIILIETIVMPIYFIGFSIFNPTRLKTGPTDTCGFDR